MPTYYTVTGNPITQSRGSSALIRAEFVTIAAAFTSASSDITARGLIAGQAWTGIHDFTAGSIKVPTLTYGTTGNGAVSMDALNQAVFSSANLPAQAGNAGKSLVTNGITPSWSFTGISLLAVLTPTAAAAINALNVFTSQYDSYIVIGESVAPSTSVPIGLYLAVAGVLDTGNVYSQPAAFSSTPTTYASACTVTSTAVNSSGVGSVFMMRFDNVNDSTGLKSVTIDASFDASATTMVHDRRGAGYKGGAVTGFGLYCAGGGNFKPQGSIRIYGIQKV